MLSVGVFFGDGGLYVTQGAFYFPWHWIAKSYVGKSYEFYNLKNTFLFFKFQKCWEAWRRMTFNFAYCHLEFSFKVSHNRRFVPNTPIKPTRSTKNPLQNTIKSTPHDSMTIYKKARVAVLLSFHLLHHQ